MIETMRWVISVALLALGLCVLLCNLVIVLRYAVSKKRSSLVPIVGGVALAVGLLVLPVPAISRFWYLGLVLDLGSLPAILGGLIFWFFRGRSE